MKIGLVGKMHAGKGEVAARLVATHGFTKLSFADPVKDASVAALNAALVAIGREPVMDRATLERDKAALRLMPQFIGTEFGRQYVGPDTIWIDMLLDRVAALPESTPVVVDDCRFVNEAEALRAAGFRIVLVERPEAERIASVERAIRAAHPALDDAAVAEKLAAAMAHPSEADVTRIPVFCGITNDGTVADLDASVAHTLALLERSMPAWLRGAA